MQIEAGLIEHYKFKTWERMRKEFLESDEEHIEFTERPIASAMNMDDLQGVFYLSGLILGTHKISIVTIFGHKYMTCQKFHVSIKDSKNFMKKY